MAKKPRQLSPLEQKMNDWVADHINRIPFVQKMLFVYHLKTMVKAGLSIVSALKVLGEEIENKRLRTIIAAIKNEVEKGKQLSEALAKYPSVFPSIYVNMIAAGETGGKLEEALSQVSNQMKKSHELTSRIRGAMIYPIVVFTAMIGIAVEMVVFVLPKIMEMFKDTKASLPVATQMLLAIMDFLTDHGVAFLFSMITIIAAFIFALRLSPSFKHAIHNMNLRLPIFGGIIKKINLARFSVTLSSLLQSTIPIIDAVKITAGVESNVLYRESLLSISEALKKGDNLSELLSGYKRIYPPMVTEMIMVGEQSGKVEDMLNELADYYSNEVDGTMKNFATIIEPVVIVVLGLMVAGIAVAVIMPMYSLAQSM